MLAGRLVFSFVFQERICIVPGSGIVGVRGCIRPGRTTGLPLIRSVYDNNGSRICENRYSRYVMDTGKNVCDPVRAEPVRGNRFASDSPRFGSSRPGGVSVSQNFRPAFGHHERMLPLGRRQPVVGQDRPAVGLVDEDAAPMLIIGSIVNTMPGTSTMPVPRRPKCSMSGSS